MSCSTNVSREINLNLDTDVTVNLDTKGGSMAGRSGPVVINITIEDEEGVFKTIGDGLLFEDITVPKDEKRIIVNAGAGLALLPDPDTTITNKQVCVNAGAGISFDSDSKLTLSLGDGLYFDQNNNIAASIAHSDAIGAGLDLNLVTNKVDVMVGNGLYIDAGTNQIQSKIGAGLSFDSDGSIVAEYTPPSIGVGLIVGTNGNIEAHLGAGLTFASDGSIVPNLGNGLTIDTNGNLAIDNSQPGVSSTFTTLTDTQFSFRDSVLYIAKVFTTYTVSKSSTGAVVSLDVTNTRIETDAVTISGGYGLPFGPAIPNRVLDSNKPHFYKV